MTDGVLARQGALGVTVAMKSADHFMALVISDADARVLIGQLTEALGDCAAEPAATAEVEGRE